MNDADFIFALMTDAYKYSHHEARPKNIDFLSAYVEARGGKYEESVFFGPQGMLKTIRPVTMLDVESAKSFVDKFVAPGVFHYEGWKRIATELKGRLPLSISALPEGWIVRTGNALMQIINTHKDFAWLTTLTETYLLQVWYPIAVSTVGYHCWKKLAPLMRATSDNWEAKIPFTLNDFGARASTSPQSAAIGGAAFLLTSVGTDNAYGVKYLMRNYNADVVGRSIQATEHSVSTCYGHNEKEYILNVINKFARPGNIFAMVGDTYNIHEFCKLFADPEIKEKVIAHGKTGGRIVVRPDSGSISTIPVEMLRCFDEIYGHTINSKGYKVLNYMSIIVGHSLAPDNIDVPHKAITEAGYAAENSALGMGENLLQAVSRGDLSVVMKASAIQFAGSEEIVDIYKDPIDAPGKSSKRGIQAVTFNRNTLECTTIPASDLKHGADNCLREVWRNGDLLIDEEFQTIKNRYEHFRDFKNP